MMQVGRLARRGFPVTEYQGRLKQAQILMHDMKVDAILVTCETNFTYFSGLQSQFWHSPTRPMYLVLPSQGESPIAVVPCISAVPMEKTWVKDIRSWPSPRPEDDGLSLVVDALTNDVPSRFGRIGMPMGHESSVRMPLADVFTLASSLEQHHGIAKPFVDASPIIRSLRARKSPLEIDKLKTASHLASLAFAELPGRLERLGEQLGRDPQAMTERMAVREMRLEMLTQGLDDAPYVIGKSGPFGYDSVVDGPTDRPLRCGDVMVVDTGGKYDGYFCDFDRNFMMKGGNAQTGSSAEDAVLAGQDSLWRATEAGLDALRPGRPVSQVWKAMATSLERDGVDRRAISAGRMGHGLGMQLTEWPSITQGEETVIQPGMVFTIEPSLPLPEGLGLVHEENAVVGECEDAPPLLLSHRAPRAMPTVELQHDVLCAEAWTPAVHR